jgi:hypothetical protein
VLTITVTDVEVVVSRSTPPQTAVYRVEWRPRLHQGRNIGFGSSGHALNFRRR